MHLALIWHDLHASWRTDVKCRKVLQGRIRQDTIRYRMNNVRSKTGEQASLGYCMKPKGNWHRDLIKNIGNIKFQSLRCRLSLALSSLWRKEFKKRMNFYRGIKRQNSDGWWKWWKWKYTPRVKKNMTSNTSNSRLFLGQILINF